MLKKKRLRRSERVTPEESLCFVCLTELTGKEVKRVPTVY